MRSARRDFERLYGASPAHLLGALASFAVIAVAAMGWFVEPAISLEYILIWFGGAIVAHDVLALPLYSALDRLTALRPRRRAPAHGVAGRRAGEGEDRGERVRVPGHVYLRVPAILAGVIGLVYSPEILGKGDATYFIASGQHQHVYLGRYLALVAALFALSGLAYLRSRHTRRG
ncbi:MAG TPA: hypothetical protein VGY13_00845 [Solirubrobacteraceae bacterium]|jgi:hypothetical protein|nr:hypothetical protein [Solirubrobacteraceae bacterium]